MPFLARFETTFLFGAVAVYLLAVVLLWTQLFLWPKEGAKPTRLVWKKTPGEWGVSLLMLGAALHLVAIGGQGPALFTNQAGVAGLFGWFLVVSYLVIGSKLGVGTGSVVAPVALCAALYSLAAPQLHSWSPPGRIDTFWLATHVFIILAGYVCLAFAFAASLLYLVQESLLKRKKLTGLWQKLPPLGVADEWIYRATMFGCALLTLGIATSIAYIVLHQPFYRVLHDPKVLFSFATWAVFALYLGARWQLGWHGRRASLIVVSGFVLMAVSFFGVSHTQTASANAQAPSADVALRP